jgi:hypothetical protein
MRAVTRVLLMLSAMACNPGAFAYRPFDGTDAAVADTGDIEVEFEPVGYLREGSDRTLVAPALTVRQRK